MSDTPRVPRVVGERALPENAPLRAAIDDYVAKHQAAVASAPVGTTIEGVVQVANGELLGKVRLTKTTERVAVWVEPTVTWNMRQRNGPTVEVTFGGRW